MGNNIGSLRFQIRNETWRIKHRTLRLLFRLFFEKYFEDYILREKGESYLEGQRDY
jgi:hypothetical protein